MDAHKKHDFMVSGHTGARWVKQAWLAELKFLIPTLLMGSHAGDAGRAG